MMCYRQWGEDGYELRNAETNELVFCSWSLGEVSRYSRDHKFTIVDRPERDESGLAPKDKAAKSKT